MRRDAQIGGLHVRRAIQLGGFCVSVLATMEGNRMKIDEGVPIKTDKTVPDEYTRGYEWGAAYKLLVTRGEHARVTFLASRGDSYFKGVDDALAGRLNKYA